jgi:hypothetical protein
MSNEQKKQAKTKERELDALEKAVEAEIARQAKRSDKMKKAGKLLNTGEVETEEKE